VNFKIFLFVWQLIDDCLGLWLDLHKVVNVSYLLDLSWCQQYWHMAMHSDIGYICGAYGRNMWCLSRRSFRLATVRSELRQHTRSSVLGIGCQRLQWRRSVAAELTGRAARDGRCWEFIEFFCSVFCPVFSSVNRRDWHCIDWHWQFLIFVTCELIFI